jgi:hypothetical protein
MAEKKGGKNTGAGQFKAGRDSQKDKKSSFVQTIKPQTPPPRRSGKK